MNYMTWKFSSQLAVTLNQEWKYGKWLPGSLVLSPLSTSTRSAPYKSVWNGVMYPSWSSYLGIRYTVISPRNKLEFFHPTARWKHGTHRRKTVGLPTAMASKTSSSLGNTITVPRPSTVNSLPGPKGWWKHVNVAAMDQQKKTWIRPTEKNTTGRTYIDLQINRKYYNMCIYIYKYNLGDILSDRLGDILSDIQ